MYSIARAKKILTFMSKTGECQKQKHTQHSPSTKTECDYLSAWIKKTVTYTKISPKMVNPRDLAGEPNAEEEEEETNISWPGKIMDFFVVVVCEK